MKHFLNITFPITSDFIKDFTINDAENIYWKDFNIDDKTIQTNHIFITDVVYKKYESENKIYYMHFYNEFFIDAAIKIHESYMRVLFLYMHDKKEYHLCSFLNDKENTHLIDITARLENNSEYWKEYYLPHCINNDNIIPAVYFYDNKSECIQDAFKYFKETAINHLSSVNTEYVLLNTDYTYERTFNSIYEERVKELKNTITHELNERKEEAFKSISKYNILIQKLTESENEYNNEI